MPKKQKSVFDVPIYKLTKSQAGKDSFVFGTIMAGAKARRSKLKPLKQSLPAMETTKAMCAVGAGLQGANKTRISDIVTKSYLKQHGGDSSKIKHQLVPLVRFAMALGVSENYACGVNDGFENSGASTTFYKEVDIKSLDYERGWHVGQAVAIESGF